MKLVDALGKPCPIPVIETKKALAELGLAGGTIEVLVDNEVAIENLKTSHFDCEADRSHGFLCQNYGT